MPAVSRKQYDLMKSVANGTRTREGLTPEQAREYIEGQTNYRSLPVRTSKPKAKKMRHGRY
jgi:hypothetical protein